MKKNVIGFVLLLLGISLSGQTHFVKNWTGNGLDQMNFYFTGATINGVNMVAGDEIAVFDGNECVGVSTLTQELSSSAYIQVVTSRDDDGTPAIDGYAVGHSYSVRVWDQSESSEISDVTETFLGGSSTFQISGSASLTIAATVFVEPNTAPVVSGIPDQSVGPCGSFINIFLDDYVEDAETADADISWTFSGNSELGVTITNRVASISVPSSGWYGNETITFIATDDDASDPLSNSDGASFTVAQMGVPAVGAITHPSCIEATGSVLLSNLPGGTWTLTRSPGGVTSNGTGASTTITDLGAGVYTYTVSNSDGCVSAPSASFEINSLPLPPTAPQPGAIIQPTCGEATGSVVLNGLPSTGIWTLTRSPGGITSTGTGSSATITELDAGIYTYTVTSAEGCLSASSSSIEIDQQPLTPAAPQPGSILQPTCGESTGSVVLDGLPASGSWTLIRSPGSITSTGSGTSRTITELVAGTYTYTVTNADGCESLPSGSVIINLQPVTPAAPQVLSVIQPSCGEATGSVVFDDLPATGSWILTRSPGGNTTSGTGSGTTISDLDAGTYTYTVTNADGCISAASASIVINSQPQTPEAPVAGTLIHPSCTEPLGSVQLNGLPESGIWTLIMTPGGTSISGTGISTTIPGFVEGTYTFTVSNADGCLSASSSEIVLTNQSEIPDPPTIETITQPSCSEAIASVVLSGLPETWTLTRSPGGSTSTGTGTTTTITDLAEGSYTYTVSNADGCISGPSESVVINSQPATPTTPVVGTITQPACGENSGSVALSGLPGAGTWTITVSPGGETSTGSGNSITLTGLVEGSHTITVTNDDGCTSGISEGILINTPPITPDSPEIGAITQPTCSEATGDVVLNGLPSSGSWTLTMSPGGVTSTGTGNSTSVANLAEGSYTFTVSYTDGCTSVLSEPVVINSQPLTPGEPVVGLITHPSCNESTGSVLLSGLPADGAWTLTRNPDNFASTGTGESSTISDLDAGTYSYIVTSADGCHSGSSATVVINEQPETPDAPVLGAITHPSCAIATGSAVLSGLPATGTWTLTRYPGGSTLSGTGGNTTITGLNPDSYTYTVSDNAVGCPSPASNPVVINLQPDIPEAPAVGTITQPTCAVATGSVVISGLPESGTWSLEMNPGGITTTGTGIVTSLAGLIPGTYTFRVSNAEGCSSVDSNPVLVNDQPDTPENGITLPATYTSCEGESILLDAGTGFDSYSWSTGASSQSISVVANGTYAVTVTEGDCSASANVDVSFNSIPDVDLGAAITACAGESVTLDAGAGFDSYMWSTGANSRTIEVTQNGTYLVTVVKDNCSNSDDIEVSFNSLPEIPLAASYYGTSCVTLDAGNAGSIISWSTGETDQSISVCASGTYSVTVTNANNCAASGQTAVTIGDIPVVDLPESLSGCEGESIKLDAGSGFASYLWSTGETSSSIFVTASGTYSVTVTDAHNEQASDNVSVTFNNLPSVDLGADPSICQDESVQLMAGSGFSSYLWSTGESSQSISVTTAGTYSVIVSDGTCSASDEVTVQVKNLPDLNLGTDISSCVGENVSIDAGSGFDAYLWSTGETSASISVSVAGNYTVTVTEDGCSSDDNINVSFLELPEVELGAPVTACMGENVTLNAGSGFASYLWSTQEVSQSISVTSTGTYSITVSDGKCSAYDEVAVTINDLPQIELGSLVTACSGSDAILDAGPGFANYLWSTGATTQTISVNTPGTYALTVSDGICDASDDVAVEFVDIPELELGVPITACSGEEIILDAGPGFDIYLWNTGEGSQTITVFDAGTYMVSVNHMCGSLSDEIEVSFNELPEVDLGKDTTITTKSDLLLEAGAGQNAYLWNTGATGSEILLSELAVGEYTFSVLVTGNNNCQNSDAVIVTVELGNGVTESFLNRSISIYPNPAGDRFFVNTDGDINSALTISIFSAAGKLLFLEKWDELVSSQSREIDISKFSTGIYVVRFYSDEDLAIRKLIKE